MGATEGIAFTGKTAQVECLVAKSGKISGVLQLAIERGNCLCVGHRHAKSPSNWGGLPWPTRTARLLPPFGGYTYLVASVRLATQLVTQLERLRHLISRKRLTYTMT